MVKCSKEEIGKALQNRKTLYEKYKNIEKTSMLKTKTVDRSYKRLCFLWTIYQPDHGIMWRDCDFVFGTYLYTKDWLKDNNYITEDDAAGINNHVHYFSSVVTDIRNLYNGGKDCYLNPAQAEFVNYYKNINLEGE